MSKNSALVCDDTPANLDFLERLLTQAGFAVFGAPNGKTAIDYLRASDDLKLAVIDMELPDTNGLQLTQDIRQHFPDACIVVATVHDDRLLMESVRNKGGNVFLVKPHGFMELFKRLSANRLEKMRDGGFLVIDQYGPRVMSKSKARLG